MVTYPSQETPKHSRHHQRWLNKNTLAQTLTEKLYGLSLKGQALRTRNKSVKTAVFSALGYDVPRAFSKKGADLPAQDLDIYVQKATNLQIWNAKLERNRRYALVIVTEKDTVSHVEVVTGRTLAKWSTTGTLTAKHQAKLKLVFNASEPMHICGKDTERVIQWAAPNQDMAAAHATDSPSPGRVLPIKELAELLTPLHGQFLPYVGAVDDRLRAEGLYPMIAKALGYQTHSASSAFPHFPHQLLDVKLQMSETLDLGRNWSSSDSPLGLGIGAQAKFLRQRDVRFAVFYASKHGNRVRIDKIVLLPGARFWDVFSPMRNGGRNSKLQIRLPDDFKAAA